MASQQPAYRVDVGRWPLVAIAATAAVNDPAALDATYRDFDALLARGRRFAVLLDLRAGASSAARRRRYADWQERNSAALTTWLAAIGVVTESSLQRGFVTAALWLVPPRFPVQVFATSEEAEVWLTSMLTVVG